MDQRQLRWSELAARLRQSCARTVDLYVPAHASGADASEWKVCIEVASARRARVCCRVDLSLKHGVISSKVQALNAYLDRSDDVDDELLAVFPPHNKHKELLARKTHSAAAHTRAAAHGDASVDDALVRALTDVVDSVVTEFRASQVQTMLASSNQHATFEFELLQHHAGLDVLATATGPSCSPRVTFTLPLCPAGVATAAFDVQAICSAVDPESLFLPDALGRPLSLDSAGHERLPSLSLVYTLDTVQDDASARQALDIAVHWPPDLTLSSHVVHVPVPSQQLSSAEVLAACEQSFADQWHERKTFVRELRQQAIVLEYDAVDFARVCFMVQEQRTVDAPLQIVLLMLTFSPAYFATHCWSDLTLTLLDGEEAVSLHLQPSPSSSGERTESDAASTRAFLAAVHGALERHFDAVLAS